MRALLGLAFVVFALGGYLPPAAAALSLEDALIKAAPSADPHVIRLALTAASCASGDSTPMARRLAIIDYSRPSTQPRLWVFNLVKPRLLYFELVAHGRNSGDNYTHAFSNALGSYQSSLGLFRTGDSYDGLDGYSLRMDGLEAGVNDRAAERAIVMHGAAYVTRKFFRLQGRLGRSQGCPAVRPAVAHALIDTLKGGQYLFAYYPDPKWLASSAFLQCRAPPGTPQTTVAAAQDSSTSAPP